MVGYYKGEPLEYVMKFVRGRLRKAGKGLSFFYLSRTTSIVSIPTQTLDNDFIFKEMTKDFQEVTAQGRFTYQIIRPAKLASVLNFLVHPKFRSHQSKDPEKLPGRIVSIVQCHLRAMVQTMSLEEVLQNSDSIGTALLQQTYNNELLESMGVQLLNVHLSALKPTPEMAKALEADYREMLQKRADEAIYGRRAAAVEQERRIRENELATEIELEQNRQELVDLEGSNLLKEAEYQQKAISAKFQPYKELGPNILAALGLKALGENASKIGNLMITPDVLTALVNKIEG